MTDEERFNDDVERAVATLREGGLILYPTDTVWGIGADATNAEAVAKIYRLKQREDSKSMLALVDSIDSLHKWISRVPPEALRLIEESERPMTVIYDSPQGVAQNLRAADGSLGIRVTSEAYSRELCRRLGHPVVSTSANISGQPAPALFREIASGIIEGVDYTATFRRDDETRRAPSGIVKVTDDGRVTIIR